MNIEEIVWGETRETGYHGVCNTLDELLDRLVAWHTQHDVEEIILNADDSIDILVSTEMKAYVF
jgi:hypothetical protein